MRETRRERRYKGRAIRKARREQAAAAESIDWAAVGRAFEAAAVLVGSVFGAFMDAVVDAWTETAAVLAEREAAVKRAAHESGRG